MKSLLKIFGVKEKAKYSCAKSDCKYESDKPGECCSQDLVKAEGGCCGGNCSC